jgi:MoaA/NifB/PqqE/SkfB family radical SAM enzyme
MKFLPSRAILNFTGDRIHALPLAIVYVTDKCNSRCVMCDYWQYGQTNLTIERAHALAREFDQMQTRWVLLSGGEPLLHPQWAEIAHILAGGQRQLWLLTAGLALKKYAKVIAEMCQKVTVSLDGATAGTYQAIRGINSFEQVCTGIRALLKMNQQVSIRCTIQRRNYQQLPALVELAHDLGVQQISFLAVDVLTHVAFARKQEIIDNLALDEDDLPEFDRVLSNLFEEYKSDFESGFIAESPAKLRSLRQYFAALHGTVDFPLVRCNAPRFSAVFTADGRIQPCFFISPSQPLGINDPALVSLRHDIRAGQRHECKTCVCSMHRGIRAISLEQ